MMKGKDLITAQEWSLEDLEKVLRVAGEMKADRFGNKYANVLSRKTFLMLFYNPSLRTRESFECAATELGGHAQFLEPKSMRLKSATAAGEEIRDGAAVMSRYGGGIGIRILEDAISEYGEGERVLRGYARYADVPVISMAHDKYHPCQALADVMGLREHMGSLQGKKMLIMWSSGHLVRSWCSVQSTLLLALRMGMNVTLAHPPRYDLDPEVMEQGKRNAEQAGSTFEIASDLNAAEGADVVYSRNWMSPYRYEHGKETEVVMALEHRDWICDERLMAQTNDAYFIHPMPMERGFEATDGVVDSKRSIIYDIAENRLHVQKAVMALTMR